MAVLDLNSVASKIYTRHFISYIIMHFTEKHIWDKNFNFIGFLKTSFYGNLKTYAKAEWIILANATYLLTQLQVIILPMFTVCETYKESTFMFLKHAVQIDQLIHSKEKNECENVNSFNTLVITL